MNEFYIPEVEPFHFVTSQLLEELFRSEFEKIKQLLGQRPKPRSLFDSPEVTVSERNFCFTLLAHRRVMDIISEMFAARYEQTSVLANDDIKLVRSTNNLVPADGPHWVLEIERVVDELPSHLFNSLPLPLRPQFLNRDDKTQMNAFESAASAFHTVEQLQTFIETVLDQQWTRLLQRWASASKASNLSATQDRPKRPVTRRVNKQRMKRDRMIADIATASETITEFLQTMDERNVQPQPTWPWPGSWKAAYKDPHLRELIHKDKSRALSRVHLGK